MLTLNRLDANDAPAVIAGARNRANELDAPACFAVTGESGNLIAFERMDQSKVTSINFAIDKSSTAKGLGKGTHVLDEVISLPGKADYWIDSTLGGRRVDIAGGLPVLLGAEVVGGIGVSSGTNDQDLEIATAAVTGFSDSQE